MVAANTPVFYLHPRERFFPCTVEWFLQHARLAVMRNILLRRKVERGEASLSIEAVADCVCALLARAASCRTVQTMASSMRPCLIAVHASML